MRLTLMVVLAMLASGCVGDGESSGASMSTPPVVTTSPEVEAEPETPAAREVTLPLPADIVLKHGVAVCPPVGRNHCVAPAGTPVWTMQEWIEGELVSLRMIATWTAASPASNQLHVFAGGCFGVEEDYTCETLAEFDAVSPIEIDIPRVDQTFNYYYIGLQVTEASPYASASTEQRVSLEGAIVWHRA